MRKKRKLAVEKENAQNEQKLSSTVLLMMTDTVTKSTRTHAGNPYITKFLKYAKFQMTKSTSTYHYTRPMNYESIAYPGGFYFLRNKI